MSQGQGLFGLFFFIGKLYYNIRLLAKLGDDGFSLVLFGTKVADSKEFCKKSIINNIKVENNEKNNHFNTINSLNTISV